MRAGMRWWGSGEGGREGGKKTSGGSLTCVIQTVEVCVRGHEGEMGAGGEWGRDGVVEIRGGRERGRKKTSGGSLTCVIQTVEVCVRGHEGEMGENGGGDRVVGIRGGRERGKKCLEVPLPVLYKRWRYV